MEDYAIERTAIRLTQKYGKKALPKTIDVVKYYLEEGDDAAAKRWVTIGYAVKRILKIDDIQDAISLSEKQAKHEEA